MKPIRIPENAIQIATDLKHPADEGRGGLHIYTLVRFAGPDTYAMVGMDASVRTVDRRWQAASNCSASVASSA